MNTIVLAREISMAFAFYKVQATESAREISIAVIFCKLKLFRKQDKFNEVLQKDVGLATEIPTALTLRQTIELVRVT